MIIEIYLKIISYTDTGLADLFRFSHEPKIECLNSEENSIEVLHVIFNKS